MKKTKIVATLGLASDTKEIISQLIEAGMNVARLNFSHGSYEWHERTIGIIRELSRELNIPVGILADLQGPRIRTVVDSELEIKTGDKIIVGDISNQSSVTGHQSPVLSLDVPGIVSDIEVGNEILIEDGLMKIRVIEKNNGVLLGEVIDGGVVKNHKGVNIPDAKLQIDPITDKDQKDLEFALSHGVDFIGLSFVSSAKNIEDLRERMRKIIGAEARLPQVISKIERKEAIENLNEIVRASDAVMVARGDLGIEVEDSRVAVLQKTIIAACLDQAKPVIVATQMLNSMIENPRPTRAEVSDVSNAVIDHADAVMLSGESASGKYPLESVTKMAEIIRSTEESPFDDIAKDLALSVKSNHVTIARSAYELAKSFDAQAILMTSATGFTARLVSHFHPDRKLLVATESELTARQLSLVWGIEPYVITENGSADTLVERMTELAKKAGRLKTGDKAVIISGRTPGEERMHLLGVREIA